MVYDKRPSRNDQERDRSSNSSTLFDDETSYSSQNLTPISESENRRWLEEQRKQREQAYLDSLPVYQLDSEADSDKKKKPQQEQSEETERAKKKEEEEEEKKKKGWLPLFRRGRDENGKDPQTKAQPKAQCSRRRRF